MGTQEQHEGATVIGVAEAKRRFSELCDEVQAGAHFIVSRRGRPVLALVRPEAAESLGTVVVPVGLAAVAGALSDWEGLDEIVAEIYAARKRAKDRPVAAFDDLDVVEKKDVSSRGRQDAPRKLPSKVRRKSTSEHGR